MIKIERAAEADYSGLPALIRRQIDGAETRLGQDDSQIGQWCRTVQPRVQALQADGSHEAQVAHRGLGVHFDPQARVVHAADAAVGDGVIGQQGNHLI